MADSNARCLPCFKTRYVLQNSAYCFGIRGPERDGMGRARARGSRMITFVWWRVGRVS